MESGRTVNAHQLAGATCSLACYRSLYTREDTSEHPNSPEQPVGGSIYQPHGGHPFQQPVSLGSSVLAVGFEQRDCPESQASTRYQELNVKGTCTCTSGSHYLEVVSHNIRQDQRSLGPASGGSFCNPVISTAESILQLETGTISRSS